MYKKEIENKSDVPIHGLRPGKKLLIETDKTGKDRHPKR